MGAVALRQPLGDLYEELGVGRDATRDEITAAYRARAKELHPDAHPDDTSASERFARVGAAYRVLSDPDGTGARTTRSRVLAATASGRAPARATRSGGGGPDAGPAEAVPPQPSRCAVRRRGVVWRSSCSVWWSVRSCSRLQRHDAELRANGVAAIATVIPVGARARARVRDPQRSGGAGDRAGEDG